MSSRAPETEPTRRYFVDEAGDPTLFDRRGNVVVGKQGCSRFFMLGLLHAGDPDALARDLAQLRSQLLADPYFRKVPSMQPAARKTAIFFHAKDDVAEVRREVFAVLRRHTLRFFAEVREKRRIVTYVLQRNAASPEYHYRANELYDSMVSRLFKNQLHKAEQFVIQFARRGASDRTAALRTAIETARRRFREKWGIVSDAAIEIVPLAAAQSAGLQAADYLLWALQRLYERGEDRFVELMWPAFRTVHDIDDTRATEYGTYYTQKKPLTLEALKERLPGI
jgi:hypothetical protein